MQEPAGSPKPGSPWRSPLEYVARSRAGVVAGLGDARAGRLHAPRRGEHARRFLFGFTAPFTLLRVAWRDAATRASLVERLAIPVALMAVALAIGVGSIAQELVDARRHPAKLAAAAKDDDEDDHDEDGAAKSPAHQAESEAARKAAFEALGESKSPMEIASAAAAAAQTAAGEGRRKAADAPPPPARGGELLRVVGRFVESRLAKVIAMLGVLEWLLVWIIREHHDVVSLQVAQLTGVPGEPLAGPPRLRFDAGWLKLKAWRALRFVIFLALGSPPAWLLGAIPVAGGALAAVWETAWAAYWGCVFAVANAPLAWEPPRGGDGAPWFVRVVRAVARVPVLGWPFRLYGWLLEKLTRAVWPACFAFERAPWESAGLALARVVAGLPPLYVVCRPMFPPAASHALVAASAEEPQAHQGHQGHQGSQGPQ